MSTIEDTRPARMVTGWTVLGWLTAFFALIFAANGAFIYYAVTSFPGLEVDSSYRAGQEFAGEMEAAAAQAARGWNVSARARLDGGRLILDATFADKAGAPERALAVTAHLEHPANVAFDRTVVLAETAPGRYTAELDGVNPGQWSLVLDASADGQRLFRSRNTVNLVK